MAFWSKIVEKIKELPEQVKALPEVAKLALKKVRGRWEARVSKPFEFRVGEGLPPSQREVAKAIVRGELPTAQQIARTYPVSEEVAQKAFQRLARPYERRGIEKGLKELTQSLKRFVEGAQKFIQGSSGIKYYPAVSKKEEYLHPYLASKLERAERLSELLGIPSQTKRLRPYVKPVREEVTKPTTPKYTPSATLPWWRRAGFSIQPKATGEVYVTPEGVKQVVEYGGEKYLVGPGGQVSTYTSPTITTRYATTGEIGGGERTGGAFRSGMGITGAVSPLGAGTLQAQLGLLPIQEEEREEEKAEPIKPPRATLAEGIIDLGEDIIAKYKDLIEKAKSPKIKQTYQQFMKQIQDVVATQKQILEQQQPTPEEPMLAPEEVAETPTDLEKLYEMEKKFYEDLQRELGIPDLIKQIEDKTKELQAIDQVYQSVIEDIQSDPDFPKTLALRRIRALQKEWKTERQALLNELNLLNTSLALKRETLQDRLRLWEGAQERYWGEIESRRDFAREQIQAMINEGTIADLSDEELEKWAEDAGYTLESLKRIREAVKKKNLKAQQEAQRQAQEEADLIDQYTNLVNQGIISISSVPREIRDEVIKRVSPITVKLQDYRQRLTQEIRNLYRGLYGTEGARERVIAILQSEFPELARVYDIAKDVYTLVPDYWHQILEEKGQSSVDQLRKIIYAIIVGKYGNTLPEEKK